MKITAPKNIQDLWKKYQRQEQMQVNEVMELFQFLLDTDQCWEDQRLAQTARYYISEGFLYHVPTL